MSPRTIAELVHREVPLLGQDQPVGDAVALVLEADLPALPVVDADERYAGIFGEREFITALFPGYVADLEVRRVRPEVDRRRDREAPGLSPRAGRAAHEHASTSTCRTDFSDIQLAEVFIHHRVLIVPVTDGGRVSGIVTRSEFFAALAERFIANG